MVYNHVIIAKHKKNEMVRKDLFSVEAGMIAQEDNNFKLIKAAGNGPIYYSLLELRNPFSSISTLILVLFCMGKVPF